jgi:uncharacterized protein (TIGR04255 family)
VLEPIFAVGCARGAQVRYVRVGRGCQSTPRLMSRLILSRETAWPDSSSRDGLSCLQPPWAFKAVQLTPIRLQLMPKRSYRYVVTLPAMFDAPDETPLARSPLVTVVWQLRIDDQPVLVEPQSILRAHASLGGPEEFSLSRLPRVQVVAQAGSSAEAQPASVLGAGGGWRLSALDGTWHVNVEASSVSVEASVYGTWSNQFSPKIERVLHAISAVAEPVIEMRIGLRYINLITGSALQREPFRVAADFDGLLEPAILGVIGNAELRQYAQVVQGRHSLDFSQAKAIVNYGVVSAEGGELGFLLDIDVYREGARQYVESEVFGFIDELHRIALGLFRSYLSAEATRGMAETDVPVGTSTP